MRRHKRSKAMADINVVPYIDVMLVLLVIFMITAPMLTQGVQVELPKSQAKALDEQTKEPMIVSVDSNGKYFFNQSAKPNEALSGEALAIRVSALLKLAKQQNEKPLVLVKGDKGVEYGEVVKLMALLQQAGADKVGLLTESPNAERA